MRVPASTAIEEHQVFETGDLSAEDRTPNFATRAYDATGIRSTAALTLFADTIGSLNL